MIQVVFASLLLADSHASLSSWKMTTGLQFDMSLTSGRLVSSMIDPCFVEQRLPRLIKLENTRSRDGIFYSTVQVIRTTACLNYTRMILRGGVDFCSELVLLMLMSLSSDKSHLTGGCYHGARVPYPMPSIIMGCCPSIITFITVYLFPGANCLQGYKVDTANQIAACYQTRDIKRGFLSPVMEDPSHLRGQKSIG